MLCSYVKYTPLLEGFLIINIDSMGMNAYRGDVFPPPPALLVAARLHNFNRSVKEVAKVVKLSEGTIRKRLGDFKDTASSRLTIEEFLKIDLEQEHDPPSFNDARKKSKQQQIQQQQPVSEMN